MSDSPKAFKVDSAFEEHMKLMARMTDALEGLRDILADNQQARVRLSNAINAPNNIDTTHQYEPNVKDGGRGDVQLV